MGHPGLVAGDQLKTGGGQKKVCWDFLPLTLARVGCNVRY